MLKNSILLAITPMILLSSCQKEEKPNVILFVVDDLGWTDLGCYGSDFYQSPNIDKLASEGMRFTDAYSSCTVCSPTRASIMSGKYPATLNCTDWIGGHHKPRAKFSPPKWTKYLDLKEFTLANAFKDAGYSTIHIGKWHLGEEEMYWPENRGFDINIGGWKVGAPQRRGNVCEGYFSPYCNPRLADGPEGEHLTERLAEEAVRFLESMKGKKQPFFMNFWFYNVHTPLQAKEDKIEKFHKLADTTRIHSNPVYAAMVEHTDDAIGRVITKLKEAGLEKNTIIIFTSDNGGLCGNYENNSRKVTSNLPLRSGKGDIFEGGVRVPFVAYWKGKIKPGTTNNTAIISTDIYPTLLSLAKINSNSSQNLLIDGVDLSMVLLEEELLLREALFWHYPHYHLEGALPYSAIRKGNWKLIDVYEHNQPMLFNLTEDIGEQNDLAAILPDKTAELLGDLNYWRNKVAAQPPVLNPDFDPASQHLWRVGAEAGRR